MPELYEQQNPTIDNAGGVKYQAQEVPNIAPATGQLAEAASRAGYTIQETQNLKDRANGVLWASKQSSDLQQNAELWLKQAQQDPQYNNKSMLDDYNTWYNEQVKEISSNAGNEYASSIFSIKADKLQTQLRTQAINYQSRLDSLNAKNNLDGIANNNASLASGNPQDADKYLVDTIHAINQAPMDDIERQQIQPKYIHQFGDTMINYLGKTNPNLLHSLLTNYVYANDPNTLEATINEFAKKNNVDAATAYAIIKSESGGKANAKNPYSNATGLGQFTPATAQQYNVNPLDPNDSIRGVTEYMRDNTKYLSNHGQQATPTNLLLTHRFGPSGGLKIIQADDNAKLSDIVGDSTIVKNNNLEGYTVGQYKAMVAKGIHINSQGYNNIENTPLWVKSLTSLQVVRGQKLASTNITSNNSVDKQNFMYDIKQQMQKANAGLLGDNDQVHSLDEFKTYYGDAKGPIEYNNYHDAIMASHAITQFMDMTPDEIQNKMSEIRQGVTSNKYNATFYKSVQNGYNVMQQQLKSNPVEFLQTRHPAVQSSWNDYQLLQRTDAPAQAIATAEQNYHDTLYAAQKHLGVPDTAVKMLSKPEINSVIATMNNPLTNLPQILKQSSVSYGKYYPFFINQLVKDGHIKPEIGLLPTINNQQIQDKLAGIVNQDYAKLVPQVSSHDIKDLKNSILNTQSYKDFVNSIPPDRRNDIYKQGALELATKYYLSNNKVYNGGSINNNKISPLFDSMYQYRDNGKDVGNITTRIPLGNDMNEFNQQADKDINVNVLKVPAGQNRTLFGNYVNSHKVWLTDTDETGARLFYMDQNGALVPVVGNDGTQTKIDFKQHSNVPLYTNYAYPEHYYLSLHSGILSNEWWANAFSGVDKFYTGLATMISQPKGSANANRNQ